MSDQVTQATTPVAEAAPSADELAQMVADEQSRQAEPAALEEEEVEWEGAKYKVAKPLKDALLREADYRKKTEEISLTRKQLEDQAKKFKADQESFAEQQDRQQKFIGDIAKMRGIEDTIAQYKQVDWDRWNETDPPAADKAWKAYQRLKDSRDELSRDLYGRMEKAKSDHQSAMAKQRAEFEKVLPEKIKGWSAERKAELIKGLQEYEYTSEDFDKIFDVRLMRLINDAVAHRAILAKASALRTQAAASGVPNITPAAKMSGGGGSQATRDLGSMSTEEYIKFRNKQERGGK